MVDVNAEFVNVILTITVISVNVQIPIVQKCVVVMEFVIVESVNVMKDGVTLIVAVRLIQIAYLMIKHPKNVTVEVPVIVANVNAKLATEETIAKYATDAICKY